MPASADFWFRTGEREHIELIEGRPIAAALLASGIPPASVLVTRDGVPIAPEVCAQPGFKYEAFQIEGYDLAAIRNEVDVALAGDDAPAYFKRRMTFEQHGMLRTEMAPMSVDDVVDLVEATVLDTCKESGLVGETARVAIGLSGGVDSTSLLLVLSALRSRIPDLDLLAITFEDFDIPFAVTKHQAVDAAASVGVEHAFASASLAQDIFHLKCPLNDVLQELMATPDRHHVMYVDSYTTRRALEVAAGERGYDTIALGLHATDLIAGLLNGIFTGYPVGPLPVRQVGDVRFIYPLAYVTKQELHLYFSHRTGRWAEHAHPNPWEREPLDRNFYYYLADLMQTPWPGIELTMIAAHNRAVAANPELAYDACENCGGVYAQLPLAVTFDGLCDVCRIFERNRYLKENA